MRTIHLPSAPAIVLALLPQLPFTSTCSPLFAHPQTGAATPLCKTIWSVKSEVTRTSARAEVANSKMAPSECARFMRTRILLIRRLVPNGVTGREKRKSIWSGNGDTRMNVVLAIRVGSEGQPDVS